MKKDNDTYIISQNSEDIVLECMIFKERNWVFKEDDDSFDFLGILINNTVNEVDPPNELLECAF